MNLTEVRHRTRIYRGKRFTGTKTHLKLAFFFLFCVSDFMLYFVFSVRSFSSIFHESGKVNLKNHANRLSIGTKKRSKYPGFVLYRNCISITKAPLKFNSYSPTTNFNSETLQIYRSFYLSSHNLQFKVMSTEMKHDTKDVLEKFKEEVNISHDEEDVIISNKLNEIESQMFKLTGISFNPNSFRDLSKILFEHLGYDTEVSYKGSNGVYSTNSKVLKELSKKGHEFPKLILEYRQVSSKLSSLKKKKKEDMTRSEIEGNDIYDQKSRKRALNKLLSVVHSSDVVIDRNNIENEKKPIKEGYIEETKYSNILLSNKSSIEKDNTDSNRSETTLSDSLSAKVKTSVERNQNRYEEIVLIDASGLIFRSYYAIPQLTRPDGQPINAVVGFISILLKSVIPLYFNHKNDDASSTGVDPTRTRVLICFDSSAKCFRSDIDSTYKAHRKATPIDLTSQFTIIKAACNAFGIPSVEIPGFEADDIIATYATKSLQYMNNLIIQDPKRKSSKRPHVTIMSSDKDLFQLVTDQISVLDPSKGIVYTPLQVQEKFKVSPNQFVDYLSMVGDSSDNIKGIPGVGPKTAVDFLNRYNSLDELINRRTEIEPIKKRIAVIENIESVLKARKLVTLEKDIPKLPLDISNIHQPQINFDIILEFLEEHALHDLGRRVKNIRKSIPEQSLTPQQPFGAGENEVPF